MKYVFFDIDCADGGKATICSFGYVIADASFRILKRKDIVMNPESRFYLKGRAGRPDVELAYPIETFKRAPTFAHFHAELKALLENQDHYIIGHSIGDDVTYLNKACKRYRLEPFSFAFFDTQRMYREIMGEKKAISLGNAMAQLEIEGNFRYHQSVEDARATMYVLKALLEKANMTFPDYLASTPKCTGKTAEGQYAWDATPEKVVEARDRRERGLRPEKGENCMLRGRKNHTLFLRYLDFGESYGEKSDKLQGKKISISMNYECNHFKEMLILAGMIKAAGGEYVLKASRTDLFATYDATDEEGNPRRCSRGEYVKAEMENGRDVTIVTFDELLSLLGITLPELEAMTPPDVEYLNDEQYRKKKQS